MFSYSRRSKRIDLLSRTPTPITLLPAAGAGAAPRGLHRGFVPSAARVPAFRGGDSAALLLLLRVAHGELDQRAQAHLRNRSADQVNTMSAETAQVFWAPCGKPYRKLVQNSVRLVSESTPFGRRGVMGRQAGGVPSWNWNWRTCVLPSACVFVMGRVVLVRPTRHGRGGEGGRGGARERRRGEQGGEQGGGGA